MLIKFAAASYRSNALTFRSVLVGNPRHSGISFCMLGVRCTGQSRFRTYAVNTSTSPSGSSSTMMTAALLGVGSLLGLGCYQNHANAGLQPVQCESDSAKKEDHYYHRQMLDLCRKVIEEEDKTHMFWPPIVMILFGPPVRRETRKKSRKQTWLQPF